MKAWWQQATLRQAWLWLNRVMASTAVFWFSGWDLTVSGWFYNAQRHQWLLERFPGWENLLYDSVPYVVTVMVLGSLIVMAGSTVLRKAYRWRRQAAYVLLVFVLGPGLLVNSLFKDHWGRARPLQVETLGGTENYTPPLYYVADGEGKSFPSGHSSVGFAFIAFWFLWREHHPRRASLALAGSLLAGLAFGLTRIAAGGHFLSDVLWSGWVVAFAAWVLYYPVMQMPRRE